MYVHIKDMSDSSIVMYLVEIYDWDAESNKDNIHKWIVENIDSYNCLTYGVMYLFEDVENAVAVKIRWS